MKTNIDQTTSAIQRAYTSLDEENGNHVYLSAERLRLYQRRRGEIDFTLLDALEVLGKLGIFIQQAGEND